MGGGRPLDARLRSELARQGFTGRVESTLTVRLGRPVNRSLAETGRLLWFDTVTGLNGDNSCGGCHSPLTGFGDTQSIAIGIDNNGIVGPGRSGPRNMRRAPSVINTAFFPRLMWNSRFASLSGDPFDNSAGFAFPPPEGLLLSHMSHLLDAQAFMHDGAFTTLETAIGHHLDVTASVRAYDPVRAGLDGDLTGPIGPVGPMLQRVDSLLASPLQLSGPEVRQLVAFVRVGLLDPGARPERLRRLIPDRVPSGARVMVFQPQR